MDPVFQDLPESRIGRIVAIESEAPSPGEARPIQELAFNLVTLGSGTYLIGDQRLPLRPGTLLWLFPDQAHQLIRTDSGFSMLMAVIRTEHLTPFCRQPENRTLLARDPGQPLCRSLDSATGRSLAEAVWSVQEAQTQPDFFNAHLAALFLRAWRTFQEAGSPVTSERVHPGVARAARELEHRPERESLTQLAHDCGLSYSRLARVFPEVFGCTLVAYRNRLRVERFKQRFRERGLTLNAAAREAGFGSYPQFHKVFRQIEGQSPAAWKRAHRRDPERRSS
jgi:AraC-like DNA-binding protein